MMNLRNSHIISGKTWIIHRKTYLWKYGPKLLHKLRWWSLFYRVRLLLFWLFWTLEGPIQLPVTCQFWFEYPLIFDNRRMCTVINKSFLKPNCLLITNNKNWPLLKTFLKYWWNFEFFQFNWKIISRFKLWKLNTPYLRRIS